MEYIKKIIQADPERMHKIFNNIMEKDRCYWKKFNRPDEIYKWLKNFSGKDEIYLALILAKNILYHNLEEIRSLWRIILMNRVKLFLLNEIFTNMQLPADIEKWFQGYLRDKCIFVGYGKASKSGQSMVYFFKQSHNINELKYMELFEFIHGTEDFSTKERIFLLDDFVGSGEQAKNTWFKKINGKSFSKVYEENPHLKFIYLCLSGFKDGKKVIEDNTPMKVILGEELSEEFKCFSNRSIIYEDPDERKRAKKLMFKKGRLLYKYPLGYDNMELAIAFFYNTPNNSLPVIWKRMHDGTWHPLFERFE